MEIKNKVFVVTGAGSGMGRQLALQLAQKGAHLALADVNENGLNETKHLAKNAKVSIHVLDITNRDVVGKFPAEVIQEHGQIDGLINNAGIIQPFVDVNDLSFEVIDRIMNVNFNGMVNMTKAFLPHLLKRPVAHIANVSSMGGFIPFPGQTLYSASKAAVKIFTEGLYSELKDTNVGVTVIHPGAVNTNIMTNSGLEAPKATTDASAMKMLEADEAAAIMIDAIERNKFRVLVGKDARMLDVFYRFSPKRAVDMIVKKMSVMK